MTDEATITAVHEAAHAIAAIRAGLVFDFVTAEPDDEQETDGALHWTQLQSTGLVVESPHLHAIVLLAGPCAEAKLRNLRIDRLFMGEAAMDDRAGIAELGLDDEQFLAATRAALELIEHDWALIERVATELLEGGDLDYEDVETLVAESDARRR
jgi:hypothetical protein